MAQNLSSLFFLNIKKCSSLPKSAIYISPYRLYVPAPDHKRNAAISMDSFYLFYHKNIWKIFPSGSL